MVYFYEVIYTHFELVIFTESKKQQVSSALQDFSNISCAVVHAISIIIIVIIIIIINSFFFRERKIERKKYSLLVFFLIYNVDRDRRRNWRKRLDNAEKEA